MRFESVEPRVLLTHSAPQLNSADVASLIPIPQNEPIASNSGTTVGAMLASGGSTTTSLPLGNNFAFFDTSNGATEGIAVTGDTGAANGAWQYSTNGGSSWSTFGNVSASNALLLSNSPTADIIRFLPNSGFAGNVDLFFAAWDATDGHSAGTYVNYTTLGGDGAFSSATTAAVLRVAPNAPPSFNLVSNAATPLENNTNGNPSGSNPGTITVPNAVSNIVPGNGGASGVTFTITDSSGFTYNQAIDGNGTLTFKLTANDYGTATLSVKATNGALSTTQSAIKGTGPIMGLNCNR